MIRRNKKFLGHWLISVSIATASVCGVTAPAKANDAGAYLANIAQCAIWLVSDPARHDAECVTTPLSGPYSSIQSTGSAAAPVREEET